jgi:predicted dehydrogenase
MIKTKDKINIVLIGLGKMGKNHLRILSLIKNVEVVALVDKCLQTRVQLSEQYDIPAFENIDRVPFAIHAAIVCTPTSTHLEVVENTLKHSHNIFLEKPLTNSEADSLRLTSLVNSSNANLQIGFIERYNPAVQMLKRVLGESNKIISTEFKRTNKLSSRIQDSDVVSDLMIHDIDLAHYLHGPVKDIQAIGYSEGGHILHAEAILVHNSGSYSRLVASKCNEKKIRSISSNCLGLYIECELLRKEIVIYKQSEIVDIIDQPYKITATTELVEVPHQEALLSELVSFVQCCQTNDFRHVPSLADALSAEKICYKIKSLILS